MIAFLQRIKKSLFGDVTYTAKPQQTGWTHAEKHTVHASDRHMVSGATAHVAEHQRTVQVRGKESVSPAHGTKIYYRTEEMGRKKRGTIVGGSHETGYEVKPVREGYVLNPPHITGVNRDHIWTAEEHTAEQAPKGTGGRTTPEESTRRAAIGADRLNMPEAEILQHPAIVGTMKGTLRSLAGRNGWNPNYIESNGVLHNDDPSANELYSEYITAAIGALRTSGANASDEDIQQFKDYLNADASESNIALTIARTGRTAAMRHLVTNASRMKEETSYDTQGEDDHESGMRAIAAQAAVGPESESNAATQEGLATGIAEQLDSLDDPIASHIIKMKFGLGAFDHGYKEADIAAALNRKGIRSEAVDQWDAQAVKDHMKAALVQLARTRGARELLGFLKSLRELSGEILIKSHIKEYTREDGTLVKEHDDKRVKKHQILLAHQNTHKEEIHSGAKLQHGQELISSLREKGWKEREVHQVKPTNGAVAGKKEDMPEPEEIKAKNRDNGALQTAERSMKKMREAAMSSEDPVAALRNINTSTSNTYTAAIDKYRETLLNHLGHTVDRNKTATKFEKDGHTITMSQDGNGHTVHFAGGDNDKSKEAITSIAGKREVQSADTGKKEPKFVFGEANKAFTAKLNPVHSKYALVESTDLTTSHTIQGHINRAYPQEIQPRERERMSSQMQMANMMNDIKPELYGAGHRAADGAPIVGKDGAVESGNGRTIALAAAYERGKADHYKEYLKSTAEKYGLKPEDVEAMDKPVLVRVRDDDDPNTDRAEFAREANDTGNLGSSPSEQAKSDAARIDDNLLKQFTPDEDGEIYNDDNMDFINGFLGKLSANEAASLRDADGDPNKKCIDRIQNAVFNKVYKSDVLTDLQAESAKPKIRNILKALNSCVGDFAQVKDTDNLDVVPDMMEAIEYTLANQGQSKAEMEHTLKNAGALDFTGDTPKFKTDHSVAMILAIADRTGSRNRLTNVFKAISNEIKNEVAERENPEVDMFAGPHVNKTKEQVVKQALDKVGRTDDGVEKSFQRQGLTHLIKSHGGTNGINRRAKVQEESRNAETGTGGSGQDGCRGREEGVLTKSQVAAYDRHTQSGALAHVDTHEDHRVRRYAIKLARTENSHQLHKLRQERFAHLPHWGTLDDHTKQRILDAEDEVHAGHKHWESWKQDHGQAKETPMAEHLPGDHSGLLQARLFKGRRISIYLLRKSQIGLFDGHHIEYTRVTKNGTTVHVKAKGTPTAQAQGALNFDAPIEPPKPAGPTLVTGDSHEVFIANGKSLFDHITGGFDLKQYNKEHDRLKAETQKASAAFSEVMLRVKTEKFNNVWTPEMYKDPEIIAITKPIDTARDRLSDHSKAYGNMRAAIIGHFIEGAPLDTCEIKAERIGKDLPKSQKKAMAAFFAVAGANSLRTLDYTELMGKKFRAHASSSERCIRMSPDDQAHTVWHECGHHIEFSHKEIGRAALLFRNGRAQKDANGREIIKPLNDLDKTKRYGTDEKAVKDKFISNYIGKYYMSGDTEVVSMGMGTLAQTSEFKKAVEKDREFLHFTVGMLHYLHTK